MKFHTNKTILIIFIISLSLRLVHFGYSKTFGTDQARDVYLIRNYFTHKQPIVLGPKASVGDFYLPPFYYYLISIPWLLSGGHPYSATVLNIIIESFTPVVIYLFMKKFWQENYAAPTAILYAISPFAIQFASFAWNPNVIPFFSITFLYFFFDYVLNRNNKSLTPSIIFATLSMQLHYQAFILFFFIFPIFLFTIFIEKRSIKPWLQAGFFSILTFIPLLFDISLTKTNIQNIFDYFINNHSHVYQTTRTFDFFWNFISRIYSLVLGYRHPGYMWGRAVFIIGSFVIGINGLISSLKNKKISQNLLFITFVICSFIGLRIYRGDKLEYFLSFLYFVPAITLVASAKIITSKRAIIIFLLSAFSAGISFPLLNKLPSDDVAKIKLVGQNIKEKNQNENTLIINLFEYYDFALKYLVSDISFNKADATTYSVICQAQQTCNIPYCINKTKPEKELNDIVVSDHFKFKEAFKVKDMQVVIFKKI